jgi:hypothetical protein
MSSQVGNISMQDAIWYSAQLDHAFQSATRILPHIEVVDIGNNKTYSGQLYERVVSNLVGGSERPIFQSAVIRTYTTTVSAYECPCFLPDVTLSNV